MREPHTPVGRVRREKKNYPVSLSVFSLVPDLLFDVLANTLKLRFAVYTVTVKKFIGSCPCVPEMCSTMKEIMILGLFCISIRLYPVSLYNLNLDLNI